MLRADGVRFRRCCVHNFTHACVVSTLGLQASLITDRNNRRSKGIAYIEFKEVTLAEALPFLLESDHLSQLHTGPRAPRDA